jgi:hypothetical protein
LPLNPYPGSDGHTTWKASPPSSGSDSGPTTFKNSTTEPGQPWVRISGSASGRGERTWAKTMRIPSISVWNCGSAFSRASVARQS